MQSTARPTIYIAGPMTGIADFNFPVFTAEAAYWRGLGLTVVNPAELHDHTDRPWTFYMRSALTAMLTCDMIVMLPGWKSSRGAKIEHDLAHELGMPVVYAQHQPLIPSLNLPTL